MKNLILTVFTIFFCQSIYGQDKITFKHINLKGSIGSYNINEADSGCSFEGAMHLNLKTGREMSINLGYASGNQFFSFFGPSDQYQVFYLGYNQFYKFNKNKENFKFEHLIQIGLRYSNIKGTIFKFIEIDDPNFDDNGKYFQYNKITSDNHTVSLSLYYIARYNFSDKFGLSFNIGGDINFGHSSVEFGIGIHFF